MILTKKQLKKMGFKENSYGMGIAYGGSITLSHKEVQQGVTASFLKKQARHLGEALTWHVLDDLKNIA